LYREEKKTKPTADILETMNDNIRVKARAVPAFELSFTYPDRLVAQMVVTALVSSYVNETHLGATVEVLEIATLPGEPVTPNRSAMTLAGLATGLLLSSALALIVHLRRKKQRPA
jgi:hypothetical protein